MKKIITIIIIVSLAIFAVVLFSINIKDEKEKIFDYVLENEEVILNGIDEINQLPYNITLDYTEDIVGIGNAKINQYVDDSNEIYVEIEGLLDTRRAEIGNETLSTILNGKPVEDIGIDNGIIIFDCGGKGIAPSSQAYAFYYSPSDEPFAVFDGQIVCETSQMKLYEEGFEYIDEGYNIFYTQKIKDNFYFCEASF